MSGCSPTGNKFNHLASHLSLPDLPQFFIVQLRRTVDGFDFGVNGDKI
jgi:hypothetical protein